VDVRRDVQSTSSSGAAFDGNRDGAGAPKVEHVVAVAAVEVDRLHDRLTVVDRPREGRERGGVARAERDGELIVLHGDAQPVVAGLP